MTFCLTFPFSRTELTMRTYSWTVPLEEGTLTDRMNLETDHHTTITIVNTESTKTCVIIGHFRCFMLYHYHYGFRRNWVSRLEKQGLTPKTTPTPVKHELESRGQGKGRRFTYDDLVAIEKVIPDSRKAARRQMRRLLQPARGDL